MRRPLWWHNGPIVTIVSFGLSELLRAASAKHWITLLVVRWHQCCWYAKRENDDDQPWHRLDAASRDGYINQLFRSFVLNREKKKSSRSRAASSTRTLNRPSDTERFESLLERSPSQLTTPWLHNLGSSVRGYSFLPCMSAISVETHWQRHFPNPRKNLLSFWFIELLLVGIANALGKVREN